MKILNLKIISPANEMIRDVDFNYSGISFIYGNIQMPEDKTSTINSLGKTLFLKMIDFIYGANYDKEIMKKDLAGYSIVAVIEHENIKHLVKRFLTKNADDNYVYLDNEPLELNDYKTKLGIQRRQYDKQIILNAKNSLISPRETPSKSDIETFLELLSFDKLKKNIELIYDFQINLKNLKENKKNIISMSNSTDDIEAEIFFIDKQVDELTQDMEKVTEKINNIDTSEIKADIISNYENKNTLFKNKQSDIEKLRIEKYRLSAFIKESNKSDISNKHILALYEKSKQEIPEMVKKSLIEVEQFHNKIFNERSNNLKDRVQYIESKLEKLVIEIEQLSLELDRLGLIIAENKVYKESIELYESYSSQLRELTFKQGHLSQLKTIKENIESSISRLKDLFENAQETVKTYPDTLKIYQDFIYELIKKIYSDNTQTYFNIDIRNYHQTARPLKINLDMQGDSGEGITEVKKNIIDYLIFKYNDYMEILVQDSSCYNGIDPRQVSNMLLELGSIADDTDKQAIIAINQYQVKQDHPVFELIKSKTVLNLSEEDTLLNFKF